MTQHEHRYITTPIYYVNDRPHIGHCYSTLLADVLARAQRLRGRDTFFLTGTDEHADRVATTAAERGLTPIQWADRNAGEFERAFGVMDFSHDDFVRTTQERHKKKVHEYISRLIDAGAVEIGDYVGWYDTSQDEYVTESTAREHEYKSPVTGKPLEKRTEQNYFFRLSRFQERLLAHIEANPGFIRPEARRNEVLGRIRTGLQDVPVSRAIDPDDPASAWGIRMPGDERHRVYVWIDALFNYISVVDTPERRKYWPASAHVLGKDILWFHAVIWPCMLMAMDEELPGTIYAHGWWIREGRKMSKSLGNFLDLPTLLAYSERYSLDGLRWFLATQGPAGANDADFAHAKFVEVFNADLANGVGNATSRVGNMIVKYFDGACPDAGGATSHAGHDWPSIAREAVEKWEEAVERCDVPGALAPAAELVRRVDGYINVTEPFRMAKDESKRGELAVVLYHCAEALRIAALLMSPAMPAKMLDALGRLGGAPGGESFESLMRWGGLKAGATVVKGDPLFQRADVDAAPPAAPPSGPAAEGDS